MTTFTQAEVDATLEQMRAIEASDAARAAAAHAALARVRADDREAREGMGALVWAIIAIPFGLGFVLAFLGGWWALAGAPWAWVGFIGGLALMALATAAVERMMRRGGGR